MENTRGEATLIGLTACNILPIVSTLLTGKVTCSDRAYIRLLIAIEFELLFTKKFCIRKKYEYKKFVFSSFSFFFTFFLFSFFGDFIDLLQFFEIFIGSRGLRSFREAFVNTFFFLIKNLFRMLFWKEDQTLKDAFVRPRSSILPLSDCYLSFLSPSHATINGSSGSIIRWEDS